MCSINALMLKAMFQLINYINIWTLSEIFKYKVTTSNIVLTYFWFFVKAEYATTVYLPHTEIKLNFYFSQST